MHLDKCLVSIIVVNYKEYGYLRRCLSSLKHTCVDCEIIVVDNESDKEALEGLKKDFGNVKLLGLKENLNYAEGNNYGVRCSRGKYIVFLNNDTIVEKNWLDPLLEAGSVNSEAFYQPKILFLEKPDTVNSFGNTVHLFGYAFPIGIGNYVSEMIKSSDKLRGIFYCSGACIFTSRQLFDKLGGFDSNYWTYYEDVNLGWRGNLFGYPSYLVTGSTIYHQWGVSQGRELSPHKFFLLERGRLSTIFRNLSTRSIIIIFPFILALDFATILYLLPKKEMAKAKVKATLEIMVNWKLLIKERKRIQKTRLKSDKDLSVLFATSIEHPYIVLPPIAKKLLTIISRTLRNLL